MLKFEIVAKMLNLCLKFLLFFFHFDEIYGH